MKKASTRMRTRCDAARRLRALLFHRQSTPPSPRLLNGASGVPYAKRSLLPDWARLGPWPESPD
jgi:hypothetical protein